MSSWGAARSGHGVGEPKAASAGEGGQRSAAARIVSLGGAKQRSAPANQTRGASRSTAPAGTGGARLPSTTRRQKATGVARCSCCVRLVSGGGAAV